MGQKKERKEKKEKPLEDRTIKELREEALSIGGIQGVHGMNKEELLAILRKAKGIPEPQKHKGVSVREVKAKINQLKQLREEERAQGAARSRLDILRRKISRFKKQTRG
jgi:hypothetical protein